MKKNTAVAAAISSEVLRSALCAHHLQKRLLKYCSEISRWRLCCQTSLSYSLQCEPFRNDCQFRKRQPLISTNSQCVAKPYVRQCPPIPFARESWRVRARDCTGCLFFQSFPEQQSWVLNWIGWMRPAGTAVIWYVLSTDPSDQSRAAHTACCLGGLIPPALCHWWELQG